IRLLNTNRAEVALPNGSYNIDYELGIIEFSADTPFYDSSKAEGYDQGGFSDVYLNKNPVNRYKIYVEFKKKIKNYFLRPNIVKGSERVMVNGKVLARDNEYIIDYQSGFITFTRGEMIDETTKIEVTYEYMPFGGLLKETLVGMRGEYRFSNDLFVGGTMLYNWASAPLEIPNIYSTPESTLVLDTDFNMKIPKNKYFPLPISINGEIARSVYNPNTLGRAMIDNMEGVRETYAVSTLADNWKISATPSGNPADPGWMTLSEDEKYLSEINDKVPETD
ncbi:unnamed protein product, partial [marine sediment metagenome]